MGMKATLIRRIRQRRYARKIAHVPKGESPHPVLDVGCSRFPIPGSDFTVDYLDCKPDLPEMRERLKGRFTRCDIHHLPFRDGTFGFVHCSNVLEHVDDPKRAFGELRRVGCHGFAECPSGFRERCIIHPDNHRWIISWKNGEIRHVPPTQIYLGGMQVLPSPAARWVKNNFPLFWKAFMFLLDQVLGVAYNQVRW